MTSEGHKKLFFNIYAFEYFLQTIVAKQSEQYKKVP